MRTGGGTSYTLRIPHRAEHDDGAKLEIESGNEPPPQICFRSYALPAPLPRADPEAGQGRVDPLPD
ncbi:hypothetical protein [Sorangium sp. So ce394]|uniref:hypothetical protein n=1 Tax=Sorangium sp. So ce394 TaxID=3133310 RepID=UPI003F5BDFA2